MWLRDESTSKATLDLLLNSKLNGSGWFLNGSLEKIVSEHTSGEKNNMMLLWPLIQTALFLNL
jgi:hypothetical protein